MKVILSADLTDDGVAARQWCAANLQPGDSVVAVVGVNQLGDFVLGIPPFDAVDGEAGLVAEVERDYCRALAEAGVTCEARLVRHAQGRAVVEAAQAERADLIVVGKRSRGRIGDAVPREAASYVVRHQGCPVLVVPTDGRAAQAVARR
jgi:nucleotide-binding universal stress UspA family protein